MPYTSFMPSSTGSASPLSDAVQPPESVEPPYTDPCTVGREGEP